jgi:tetraacyldisaccharide 4'-kinase
MGSPLMMISPFWASLNCLVRNFTYSKRVHFQVPVISVGNIVAGGVGKTEICAEIARYLIFQKNKKVVIVSRGYGSEWEKKGGVAFNYQEAIEKNFPDEAKVVLKKVPGSIVCVGKDRTQILKENWENLNPDVILLDDGFQHFKIHRDLDILVHDFSLQNQILRDFPSYFSKVGVRISFSEVPKIWSNLSWTRVFYKLDETCLDSKIKNVILFCGIGNPSRVVKMLKENGYNVVAKKFFKDHKNYSLKNINDLSDWVQKKLKKLNFDAQIVTTLKDFVKLEAYLDSNSFLKEKLKLLKIDLKFYSGENLLWDKINQIIS